MKYIKWFDFMECIKWFDFIEFMDSLIHFSSFGSYYLLNVINSLTDSPGPKIITSELYGYCDLLVAVAFSLNFLH